MLVYAALLLVVGTAFATLLGQRVPMELQVTRNRTQMFGSAGDGRLTNAYTLFITNCDRASHDFEIVLEAPEAFELVAGSNPVAVDATRHMETRVFVIADPDAVTLGPRPTPIRFRLRRTDGDARELVRASTFVVPGGARRSGAGGVTLGR